MQNRFIALDLELEQPRDDKRVIDSHLSEERIIQVGWVVFEESPFDRFAKEPFKVLCRKSVFVNIGVPLSTFIKNLTKISDKDIQSGGTLKEAYTELAKDREKYETSRIVRQWGGGDMECFRAELMKLEGDNWQDSQWEFGRSGDNVKYAFQTYARIAGIDRRCGLRTCVNDRLGLRWLSIKGDDDQEKGAHQADVDALNTALVSCCLFDIQKRSYEAFLEKFEK